MLTKNFSFFPIPPVKKTKKNKKQKLNILNFSFFKKKTLCFLKQLGDREPDRTTTQVVFNLKIKVFLFGNGCGEDVTKLMASLTQGC